MPSLSDKLKSLGVNLGTKNFRPPIEKEEFPIEKVIPGSIYNTPFGETFVVESHYSSDYSQGTFGLVLDKPLDTISSWIGDHRLKECTPHDLIFLDTETSGLSGGTGIYAFLIGVGHFTQTGFHLLQYFMRDPFEEPAQLAAFASFLNDNHGLITFNGKSFDVPLLNTRFVSNGEMSPLKSIVHLDLLPLARKLWRDRLPSRSLGSLEQNILGAQRTHEDVPGWLIPNLYFDYIRHGDARPLKNVFYHNAMDILSLAALLNLIATLIEEPLNISNEYGLDILASAKLYEELGRIEDSALLYARSLDCKLPNQFRCEAIRRWSFLEKRSGNMKKALKLWQQATSLDEIYAFIELAKYYEHRKGNYDEALHWTTSALEIIQRENYPPVERWKWEADLKHRQTRLHRKRGKVS
jgi:uncharacterized protein